MNEMGLIDIFGDYIDLSSFGYIFLFLYSIGGGYVGILAAGAFSAAGKLNLIWSILIAVSGNMFGSSVIAIVARYQRKDLMSFLRRSGRLRKNTRRLAMVSVWLRKYGWWIIVSTKFVHGLKSAVPVAVGISRYGMIKYVIINFLACFTWGVLLGLAGFYSSESILFIARMLFDKPYLVPLAVALVASLMYAISYLKRVLLGNRI